MAPRPGSQSLASLIGGASVPILGQSLTDAALREITDSGARSVTTRVTGGGAEPLVITFDGVPGTGDATAETFQVEAGEAKQLNVSFDFTPGGDSEVSVIQVSVTGADSAITTDGTILGRSFAGEDPGPLLGSFSFTVPLAKGRYPMSLRVLWVGTGDPLDFTVRLTATETARNVLSK